MTEEVVEIFRPNARLWLNDRAPDILRAVFGTEALVAVAIRPSEDAEAHPQFVTLISPWHETIDISGHYFTAHPNGL
ncbi:MAG TPA: hypothetical protein VGB97_02555 [Candidatus Paceibacterota bacterium]